MKTQIPQILTKNPPTRRAVSLFFWISMGCVSLGIGSIVIAEIYMPKNIHGETAILTFYRSFGPFTLFWLIGGCIAWVYAKTLTKAGAGSETLQ
jgi:hypothetical protein